MKKTYLILILFLSIALKLYAQPIPMLNITDLTEFKDQNIYIIAGDLLPASVGFSNNQFEFSKIVYQSQALKITEQKVIVNSIPLDNKSEESNFNSILVFVCAQPSYVIKSQEGAINKISLQKCLSKVLTKQHIQNKSEITFNLF